MVYFGSTQMTLSRRMGCHYRAAKSNSHYKFATALRNSIPSDWMWDVISCFEEKQQARDLEMELIKKQDHEFLIFGLPDKEVRPRVYNSKPGYGKASEELKAKFRAAKIGHVPWNKGKNNIYSEETKLKMSEAKLGKKLPKWSEKRMAIMKSKFGQPIKELTTGLEFESHVLAAKHFAIRREMVRDVVNGKRKTTNGLVFTKLIKD